MIAATILFVLTMPIEALSPQPSLAALRDTYRPLLILAPNGDPRLSQQMQMLKAHRAELLDRQIMLVPFFHKYAGGWDEEIEIDLVREEVALRRRFRIRQNEYTVILIGKDGGEKFRSHTPVTIEQLIKLIDAMPMRQQEMKNRHPHQP